MNLTEKCLNWSRCFDSRYSAENYKAWGSDICFLPMKQTERITHLSRAFVPDPNIDVGLCGQSMNLTEKCVNFSRCFHSRYSTDNYEASGSDIGGLLRFYLLLMKQTSGGLLLRHSCTMGLCWQPTTQTQNSEVSGSDFRGFDLLTHLSRAFVPHRNLGVGLCGEYNKHKEKQSKLPIMFAGLWSCQEFLQVPWSTFSPILSYMIPLAMFV